MQATVSQNANPDLQGEIEKLFLCFPDSPTFRCYKLINQAALLAGVTALKLGVNDCTSTLTPQERFTKDVRTPDGWSVTIDLTNPNVVVVTHLRKEQSLDVPSWFLVWRLRTIFASPACDALVAADISVDELTCDPAIPATTQDELRRVFRVGQPPSDFAPTPAASKWFCVIA